MPDADPYTEWCRRHGVTHGHCPDGCSHPQPIALADGRLVCGRCLVRFGEAVGVVPCGPGVCGEAPALSPPGGAAAR